MRSYPAPALRTFGLQWLFWLTNVIANLILYRDAKERERVAGKSLSGAGCLTTVL